jgi:hypothetical protein
MVGYRVSRVVNRFSGHITFISVSNQKRLCYLKPTSLKNKTYRPTQAGTTQWSWQFGAEFSLDSTKFNFGLLPDVSAVFSLSPKVGIFCTYSVTILLLFYMVDITQLNYIISTQV